VLKRVLSIALALSVVGLPSSALQCFAKRLVRARRLLPWTDWRCDALPAGLAPLLRDKIWQRLVIRDADLTWTLPLPGGGWLRAPLAGTLGRNLFRAGTYEPNELWWFLSALQAGGTVLDVGANIGLYTVAAALRVGPSGKVIACEASPRETARLRDNLVLNRLENVQVIEGAASDRSGVGTLEMAHEVESGHNTLGSRRYAVPTAGTVEVALEPLDAVLTRLAVERVDAIKLDVEGHEVRALNGLTHTLSRYQPKILLELDDDLLRRQGASAEQVRAFLGGLGYRLFRFAHEGALEPLPPGASGSINVVALPGATAPS
jgi:FkbM family methyltransferase